MKTYKFINILLSAVSAILLILSTAGFGFSFLVFIAFVPLFFAIKFGGLKPVLSGWIVGFIYWIVCLSWMTTIFGHFGGAPMPAAVGLLLLVAIIGGFLFFGLFGLVAGKSFNPILLALVFIILELAKSQLFFGGVPWLNLAQSQYKNLTILSFVSVFGEFGLSFMIMLVNIFIFKLLSREKFKRNATALVITVIIILIPGFIRKIDPIKVDGYSKVKIIQTGLKQEDKWNGNKVYDQINEINGMLAGVQRHKYNLIVLPESAYPVRVIDTPYIMDVISDVSFDTPIILGSDRSTYNSKGKKVNYNTMYFFHDGLKNQIYDKMHLTPFGEYFPFEKYFEPIKKYFFGAGSLFSPGNKSKVFKYKNMIIAPLICFEGAFSELVHKPVAMGANMMAIISNDSWFGDNMGRTQHLAVDTMRAAEYARSAVRSTQDGISAVILPNGKIPVKVTEQKPAQIDYDVPLVSTRTIYSYIGVYWIVVILIVAVIMELTSRITKKGRRRKRVR